MSITEFESIKIIGKGAFGEVRICRHKKTDAIYAIKKIKKESLHIQQHVLHIRNEKQLLADAHNSWIVNLEFSFQVLYVK